MAQRKSKTTTRTRSIRGLLGERDGAAIATELRAFAARTKRAARQFAGVLHNLGAVEIAPGFYAYRATYPDAYVVLTTDAVEALAGEYGNSRSGVLPWWCPACKVACTHRTYAKHSDHTPRALSTRLRTLKPPWRACDAANLEARNGTSTGGYTT